MSSTLALHNLQLALAILFAPDCSSGVGSGSCDLHGLLHLLYVIAGVLAVILVAVVAFAIHAWRKTKEVDITHR